MKGNTMNIESPEVTFLTKVHEITSKADVLIESYIDTSATIACLPPDTIPHQEAALALAQNTAETIAELKTLVTLLVEHSSEVNDQLQSVVDRITAQKD
jgi:hypothetical protein